MLIRVQNVALKTRGGFSAARSQIDLNFDCAHTHIFSVVFVPYVWKTITSRIVNVKKEKEREKKKG